MPHLRPDRLVFIDEAHFISLDQWKQYGWYEKGSFPLAFRQNLWKKQSCSLLLAIGDAGHLLHVIKPHSNSSGVKEIDFLHFLLDLHEIVPKNHIFIMDNARIHKSKLVKTYIKAMNKDGRHVLYQAKYSPELNPIEYCFGFLKRRMKNHDQIPRDLFEDVELCVQTLTESDCQNSINHVFGSINLR